jgi:hypothetical protein
MSSVVMVARWSSTVRVGRAFRGAPDDNIDDGVGFQPDQLHSLESGEGRWLGIGELGRA